MSTREILGIILGVTAWGVLFFVWRKHIRGEELEDELEQCQAEKETVPHRVTLDTLKKDSQSKHEKTESRVSDYRAHCDAHPDECPERKK